VRDDAPAADRAHHRHGDLHRTGEPVDPAQLRGARDAVGQHDVEGEQRCVRRRERDPERLAAQLYRDQDVDPGGRERERNPVAQRAYPHRGQQDHGEELDRGHRAEGQPRDRLTGEDCSYMKLHLGSIEELPGVLDRFLLYGETTTSIVNATPVPRRDPPPRG
jgi:hypothetical protein